MAFQAPPHLRRTHNKCDFEETLTEQHHRDDCRIDSILKKYAQTGVITHVNRAKGTYGDFSAPDYQEAQNIIAAAKSLFEDVPAHIRLQFNNDPAEYIEFMQEPTNKQAIEELGLDASHLPDLPEHKNDEPNDENDQAEKVTNKETTKAEE